MAGGFRMEFVADVAKFIRGTRDVESALDDVSDSLDDLARDAQRSADKTGEAFDDAGREIADGMDDARRDAGRSLERVADDAGDSARDVETSAERMEKSFREAFDAAEKNSKDVAEKVSTNTRRGFDDATQATETFRDEAKSNLSETVSSFRGDTEDFAQIAQDVLGGVVADLGVVGAAAGTAGAVAIGVTVEKLTEMAEKINEAKEAAGELAIEFKDAGGRLDEIDLVGQFDEWLVTINDAREWFEVWQKDAVTNLDDVRVALKDTGLSLGDLYEAFSDGDTTQLEEYVEKLKEVNRELVPEGHQANTVAQNDEYQARKQTIAGLEEEIEKRRDAQQMADEMRAAEEGVTVEVLRQRDALRASNDELRAKNDLTRESITADLDFEDALAGLTGTGEGWTATLDKSNQLGRDNQRVLIDATSDLQKLADATLEQTGSQEQANAVLEQGRQRLVDAAVAAGYDRSEVEKLTGSVLSVPLSRTTEFDVDTEDARRKVESFIATMNQSKIKIGVSAETIVGNPSMGFTPGRGSATGGPVEGKAGGGVIPGMPSSTDNAGLYRLATGEYVVNAAATAKNRQLLDAINQGRPAVDAGARGGASYEVHVHAAPGMSERQVADLVVEKIREHEREQDRVAQYL